MKPVIQKLVFASVIVTCAVSLGSIGHLSWLEAIRLILILAGTALVLHRMPQVLSEGAGGGRATAAFFAVAVAFIVTQFDASPPAVGANRPQLNTSTAAIHTLWVVCGVTTLLGYWRTCTRNKLTRLDRVVLGTLFGVLIVGLAARSVVSGSTQPFGKADVLRLLTYVGIWVSITRAFSDEIWFGSERGRLFSARWLLPILASGVLMTASATYGIYRVFTVLSSLEAGQDAFVGGNFSEAADHYERALALNTSSQVPWARDRCLSDLAVIYFKEGNEKQGELAVSRLASRTPDRLESLIKVGDVYGRSDMWMKSAKIFEQALDMRKRVSSVLDRLATAYLKAGDSQALLTLMGDHEFSPSSERDVYDELILLGNLQFSRGKFGESLDLYRQASDLRPSDWYSTYKIGLTLLKQRQARPALAKFQQAVGLKSDFAEGFFRIGQTHEMQNDVARAEEAYARCLEILPAHHGGRLALERLKTL